MSNNKSDHDSDSDSDSGTNMEGYSLCYWCREWVCLEDCGNDYTGYICYECGEHLPESLHFDERKAEDFRPSDWEKIGGKRIEDSYYRFKELKDYNLYKKVIINHYKNEEGHEIYRGWTSTAKEIKKGDVIAITEGPYEFGEVINITNQYIYYE